MKPKTDSGPEARVVPSQQKVERPARRAPMPKVMDISAVKGNSALLKTTEDGASRKTNLHAHGRMQTKLRRC